MKNETINIDNCECVYCGNIFDGRLACNGNMDECIVACPMCKKEMQVDLSIEYTCHPIR